MKRAIVIAALSVSAVAIAADTLTLDRDVDLRAQKMTMSPVVASAKKGDTLTVLESGDVWLRVQQGDTVAWLRKSDLGGGNSMNTFAHSANAGMNGDAAAGAMSEGNAGKGLNPGAEDFAKATGTDPKPLDRLIALRKKLINDGTLAKFDKQGNVGIR